MTAKEALRERVDRLSGEEAAEWLARMESESTSSETLTGDELAQLAAAAGELGDGRAVDGDEVFRKLGL